MTDDLSWYEAHAWRTDMLGHTEPRRNDALHVYLRAGGKLSEYPRAEGKNVSDMIDAALGLRGALK